uniref:Protein kinase domain-containing protein n=1 Tax=Neogobius melanostomus TaxID=47308 RepID=A0A8C6SXX4_9GOBI
MVEDGNDPADMYNLLELMGEGYFGKVIKCLNKETCEIVAVKEIKIELKNGDAIYKHTGDRKNARKC